MSRQWVILLAAMLVTFVTGSVHSFSVFVLPLETLLQLPRSEISLIYSFALVGITLAVLFGYRYYASLRAWWLVLACCLSAALGLLLAAAAQQWWQLFVGYSLMFGISNGFAYGFSLQLVGREMPQRKGFAMGAVTAAYAVGSIVFSYLFAVTIDDSSVSSAFHLLAVGLAICGLLAALMMHLARADYGRVDSVGAASSTGLDGAKILHYWLAYMTSVFAGLMAIGHAAGIAVAKGASLELSTLSAMIIGIGSAGGGFLAGWLIDRWPAKRFLVGLPLLSALALLLSALVDEASAVVGLLSLVGFSYGSIIAIYPVVISNDFGDLGAKAYGRIFTAWGFAGLVAPWVAGLVFDWQAGYQLALLLAAVTAVLSALIASRLAIKT